MATEQEMIAQKANLDTLSGWVESQVHAVVAFELANNSITTFDVHHILMLLQLKESLAAESTALDALINAVV